MIAILGRMIIASMIVLLTTSFAHAQDESSQPIASKPLSAKSRLSRDRAHAAKKATAKPKAKSPAAAAKLSKTPEAKKGKPLAASSQLSRDIVFDGSNVNGQYHSAGEAVAKVEQEKKMNNLVGIRQDFKDRLSAERDRLKRGEAASVQ